MQARQTQQQQLSFTLLLALSLSHCTDCCLSLSSLSSNTLHLLHNNDAGEGGGLTLPIGEGEGVAVGCGPSLHYN